MKVLVTGATGFVGPKIVHALRARGHDVRALVRRPERAKTLRAWGCELAEGDMTDAGSLRRAVDGCGVVVHVVAVIRGSASDFDRVMVGGTESLIGAAKEAGVGRFVLMSALGTNERNRELVPYFRSKWAMEQALAGSGLERVTLPDDLVARLEGKSSLGRLGLLIHSTAGFIDPGWDGHVTLELSNVANLPITIYPGMKIGQISFMQMTEPAATPYGSDSIGSKYKGQRGPTASRYWQNFERGE